MEFGWSDPVEERITLRYRRKGRSQEHTFSGPVYVLSEDKNSLEHVPRTELPGGSERLDLTGVPVVGIGGKRKRQLSRVRQFLDSNPGFEGVFLLYPGTGSWDLGSGHLIVTDREILAGRRVSGGRLIAELTNYRWVRDGRYVADRAKMLHGKVLETIEAELEQEPGVEMIVKAIAGWKFPHRLRDVIGEVSRELGELEEQRVMLTDEQSRNMTALVHERLVVKFREAGVRYVRDIPEDLTVTAEEIAPELVLERDTLGTVEVPGLGRQLPKKQYARFGFGDQVPTVEFSIEEFRRLESWPFVKVYPVLTELGDTDEQLDRVRTAVEAPEAERLDRIREFFSRRWLDVQRSSNRPDDEKVADPLESDPPATPEPVVWGFDLMTGEKLWAYAGLVHDVYGRKGRIVDGGWSIRWYDDAEEAAKADAEARREAESFITARRLEAELTAEARVVADLPVVLPVPFHPFTPDLSEVMRHLGFTAEQFRIEGEGPGWRKETRRTGSYRLPMEAWGNSRDSKYADRYETFTVEYWWRKENEVVVVFTNTTVRHLIGDGDDWGAASQLEVAKEKIQAVREWLATERQKVEDSYRAQVRQFVQNLQSQPAHLSLSSEMQAKLAGLADSSGLPDPSRIADELRTEWVKAEALHAKVESGDILTNFGGHFRVMGATSQAQYWVIRPDGSERGADKVEYRKRYTSEGNKGWRLVGPEELAVSWFKAYTAADHEFVVNKLPASGECTLEQLATVRRLEREIDEQFRGTTGMSGKVSPDIAEGWNLD